MSALLNPFFVEAPLGAGSHGNVFLAQDRILGIPVALKCLPQGTAEALLAEARAVAPLQHENVVRLYRVDSLDGQPCLVYEYVPGKTLRQLLEQACGALPWQRALELGRGLARGLAAVHRARIVHADIKPANVMVTTAQVVKILDFGLAKLRSSTVAPALRKSVRLAGDPRQTLSLLPRPQAIPAAASEAVIGTPLYAAPEVWALGEPSARSDVYSIGAVIYEMCTGNAPLFETTDLDDRFQIPPLGQRAPVLPVLGGIVDRCLRQDPAERFADAVELERALEALAVAQSAAAGDPYPGPRCFAPHEHAIFFGRQKETGEVRALLSQNRILFLTADSAAGKTSFCRAGLLPQIQRSGLFDGDGRFWSVVRIDAEMLLRQTPPVRLTDHFPTSIGHALDLSRDDTCAVSDVRSQLGSGTGLLLFFDGTEELASGEDTEVLRRLGGKLGTLTTEDLPVRVLWVANSQQMARIISGLRLPADRVGVYALPPLEKENLAEAIERPALTAGLPLPAGLCESLCQEAQGRYGLLQLQFMLKTLWRDHREKNPLPESALAQLRFGHAVEMAFSEASPALRAATRRILLRSGECSDLAGDAYATEAMALLCRIGVLQAGDPDPHSQRRSHPLLPELSRRLAREALQHEAYWRVVDELEWSCRMWLQLGRRSADLGSTGFLQRIAWAGVEETALGCAEQEFLLQTRSAQKRQRTQRLARWGAGALLLLISASFAGVFIWQRWQRSRQAEFYQASGMRAKARAEQMDAEIIRRQPTAFAAFDAGNAELGEKIWRELGNLEFDRDGALQSAWTNLAEARRVAPNPSIVREQQKEVLYLRLNLAEREFHTALVAKLLAQAQLELDASETEGWLNAPGRLSVTTGGPQARIEIYQYAELDGIYKPVGPLFRGPLPLRNASFPPGSYLLIAQADGRTIVHYPLLVRRGQTAAVSMNLPPQAAVPPGFIFVPAGSGVYGCAEDEIGRKILGTAQPQHPVEVPAFLIARTEVTFAEWIEYLKTLPRSEWSRNLPQSKIGDKWISLDAVGPEGPYSLTLRVKAKGQPLVAHAGQLLSYPSRSLRRKQNWLRFPVSGVSFADAQQYALFLRRRGIKGARLCTEKEWEHAARGADARKYPHGELLHPQDANFDETYERTPGDYGPDEVGSHPESDSPFGVADMAGNVWEWTASGLAKQPVSYRGGEWFSGAASSRSCNREPGEVTMRDPQIGVRICAEAPP